MVAGQGHPHIGCAGYLVYSLRSMRQPRCGVRFGVVTRFRPTHMHLLDATVPLVVGAVIVVGGVLHGSSGERPLVMAAGLGAAASLVARRRAPGWTLAVSGGLALLMLHVDPDAGPAVVIAPGVALYSLALTRGRGEQLAAAAAAVTAVVAVDALHGGAQTLPQTLGHVLLVAIPLLAAEAHRNHRAYLSLLREQLELAERTREQEARGRAEQERMRIARELHDVVAHTLTTINVQAATAAQLLDRDPDHARGALETIEDASRDAIDELRAVLGVLRTGGAEDAPLSPAPGIDGVAELVRRSRADGLEVRFDVRGERPERLPDPVSLAAFRIVQESLTNACRHAAGASVRVGISFGPDLLALAVESGAGTDLVANGDGATQGVGIMGMSERASAVGGTLRAGPLGGGFMVDAELPYSRPAR